MMEVAHVAHERCGSTWRMYRRCNKECRWKERY
jgi:hypothetical protein